MFDLVINHVSKECDWFRQFCAGDIDFGRFSISYEQGRAQNVAKVFRPRTHPLHSSVLTKRGDRLVWTTFSDDQIDLNFRNPEVLLAIVRVLLFYIERGAKAI